MWHTKEYHVGVRDEQLDLLQSLENFMALGKGSEEDAECTGHERRWILPKCSSTAPPQGQIGQFPRRVLVRGPKWGSRHCLRSLNPSPSPAESAVLFLRRYCKRMVNVSIANVSIVIVTFVIVRVANVSVANVSFGIVTSVNVSLANISIVILTSVTMIT